MHYRVYFIVSINTSHIAYPTTYTNTIERKKILLPFKIAFNKKIKKGKKISWVTFIFLLLLDTKRKKLKMTSNATRKNKEEDGSREEEKTEGKS